MLTRNNKCLTDTEKIVLIKNNHEYETEYDSERLLFFKLLLFWALTPNKSNAPPKKIPALRAYMEKTLNIFSGYEVMK